MIYVLHDSKYDTYLSRGDTFNRQWMATIQKSHIVKFAPIGMSDFRDGDIVIIYLDNAKPYGSYALDKKMKKIFIVGELNADNHQFLKQADYIIYLSEHQKKVAEDICGIVNIPSYTYEHHPMPVISVDIQKKNRMFIGGMFTNHKATGFIDRIKKLHAEYPTEVDFVIYGGGSGPGYNTFCEKTHEWLTKSDLNGKRQVQLEFQKFYASTFFLNLQASKYVYLWKNEPSLSESLELINNKSTDVLKTGIRSSSLLAAAKKYGCDIVAEDRLVYSPHFSGMQFTHTFLDFANKIDDIIKSI